jgi:hypothetical protein
MKESPPGNERRTMRDTPPQSRKDEEIALTIVQDGKTRQITVRELAVGNKLAGDALLSLLVDKGMITAEEFYAKIEHLREQHYRPGTPPPDKAQE